ncbi:MAG: hypothetical protein GOMPHAMPRED_002857 [Gomphillus americanus]|uniref:Uncharacterized protein n=1 Tax=Gomphillus americanus TaxID=1940652 RepID=A0A8H3FIP2_9LECA|nr:MAG: hypothetical protein GOMPHAMPRED_002857 [Gomphillus americanus]
MGVTGLWTVVQGCARPTKLETLNKKRLAVDASIWIYQFLKAVRDKEGKALRNSHVVGFFRRICKLLYFGIKPVFVFDGGAPTLKRQTINNRRARREGRRENAIRTAGKLLAVQMQRRAEEEAEKARARTRHVDEEEIADEDLVYVSEVGMTEQERKRSRGFKKKDQYHLPDLDVDIAALGAPNDPRVMSQEELEEYARQFHSGEDINFYDFSKIDFESPFFVSLPASDRYNILNAARLRSRLRMGYSKEQLETMFPDRMAFSRFQVERVKERNELTQRLMNLNGMNGQEFNVNGRVAGEKGKEYVLVKNDGVDGGWALGVVGNKDGDRAQPIDVDRIGMQINRDEDEGEDGDAFQDVPIEGLNRLPKHPALKRGFSSNDDLEKRKNLYLQRQQKARSNNVAPTRSLPSSVPEDESLFVDGNPDDAEFEDIMPHDSDDEELRRAIAMSLEQEQENEDKPDWRAEMLNGPAIDQPLQYNKKNAKAGRAFAHVTNERANKEVPSVPFTLDSDGEESGPLVFSTTEKQKTHPKDIPKGLNHNFSGPLPFESLKLGKFMLGKKKKQEDEAGGFEKEEKKTAEPLPPWFSANLEQSYAASNNREKEDRKLLKAEQQRSQDVPILHRHPTREVIDIDDVQKPKEIIDVDENTNEDEVEMLDVMPEHVSVINGGMSRMGFPKPGGVPSDNSSMDDLVKTSGVEPSGANLPAENSSQEEHQDQPDRGISGKTGIGLGGIKSSEQISAEQIRNGTVKKADIECIPALPFQDDGSESDAEFEDVPVDTPPLVAIGSETQLDKEPETVKQSSKSAETLALSSTKDDIKDNETFQPQTPLPHTNEHIPNLPQENTIDSLADDAEFDDFSDPDEVDLLRSLAEETEEHARFAASLAETARSVTKEDYEKELKQLRNQQKRDLRDSDEVTQIMITECQQLLKFFGLPYITAPMEAEAQCAELVSLGLVDGIVTDDSDVFLFGGTRVYKNMFNQAKYVECYLASDLEKEYSLTREKVISAAQLLGSDYTEGLPHVGPVTAMEILSEFPSLVAFRDWWEGVQAGKKLPGDDKNPFRRKFRKNAAKVFLPLGFPDPRVDQAYLHPEVDSDPSPFIWGVPDLDALRGYLMATIGWNRERADEILVPVIRDMNRREVEGTQANITRFFSGPVGTGTVVEKSNDGFAPRRKKATSSRMETALGRIHRKAQQRLRGEEDEQEDEVEEPKEKSTRRKKRSAAQEQDDGDDDENSDAHPRKAARHAIDESI